MRTKKCSKCGLEKEIVFFHSKKTEGRTNSWCKECVYERQRRRWTERKFRVVEIFGGKCVLCGYNKNLSSLDFHHLDPAQKDFSWNKLREMRWELIINELKKCILICSNCHGEIHNPKLNMAGLICQNVDNCFLNRDFISLYSTGKCLECGDDVYGTKYCSVDCAHYSKRKARRPTKDELQSIMLNNNWEEIGRMYKVSSSAIKKWARQYGITWERRRKPGPNEHWS